MSSYRTNSIYIGTTIFIVAITLFALFVFFQITLPFTKLANILKSVILGKGEKIEIKKKDEFERILQLMNDIIDKFEKENLLSTKKISETQKKSTRFIQELSKHFSDGLIVTNAENNIIYFLHI